MSKHTPGAWGTDQADHDSQYQDIKIKAGQHTICTVWIDDAPEHDFNARQSANARLIAAAPEMLNALKYIVGCSAPMTSQQEECWKAMREAIAKAESEAHCRGGSNHG